jgi:FkbM family methyltransferase
MKFETIHSHSVYIPPLNSDSVVLDLGANRGEFAKQMSARFGGKYYLVEANPKLAEQLRAEGRFPVWQCAVGDKEGAIEFHIAHNDAGSSLLELPKESPIGCTLLESIVIQARSLESLIAEMDARLIDLLKMDIEGAEVAVLRDLPVSTLRRIGQITVEFHSDPLFGFDIRQEVEDVICRLRGLGFFCLDFSGVKRGDVLFLNRHLFGIPRLQGLYWEALTSPPHLMIGRGDSDPEAHPHGARIDYSLVVISGTL